jgi:hypothetical protein
MRYSAETSLIVSFDALALERCFLAAEILDAKNERPIEYGLIGLAAPTNPFHVVATPLLCGQEGTETTVRQSGRAVLRMREEIAALSEQLQTPLLPIAFIHRHPGPCHISETDDEFLTTVFVDQVAAAVFATGARPISPGGPLRAAVQPSSLRPGCAHLCTNESEPLFAVASFGLIVNRFRQFCVYAVYRESCALCRSSRVGYVPCRLVVRPDRPVEPEERRKLLDDLEMEIEQKVHVRALGGAEN